MPAVSVSTIKRAAKLMAASLKSVLPPPAIQQLVSNPALLRALVDELSAFVGGDTMSKQVTAGRKQVVFLGNTGPNNAREWVVIQYRNGPNGNGEKVMRVSQRLGLEPRPDQPVQWTDLSFMRTYLKNMRPKLSRPGVMLMNKLAGRAAAATEFTPYGVAQRSGSGRYFGRRASDSRIVPMKPAEAEKVADRPAAKTSADAPTDWLGVWWVPPEYGKESLFRVKSGWIKPLWDWGRGRLVKKGEDVVKAACAAATEFTPYGVAQRSGAGRYFGRRASDSRIVPMKPAEAEKVADRPAAKTSADAPTDWLGVWWVPPEYGKEGLARVKSGWIKPLWDWGRGRLVQKGEDVVKAARAKTEVRAVDEDMVYELKVYIENDAQLYKQRTRPVQENLEKKWKKGKYDHAQAPKLWLYLVNDGAKKYMKEMGVGKIDPATRKQVAQELADEWQMEMEAQLGPMGGAAASTRVQAGTWQEQAKAELEAELGGIETDEGRDSGRDYFTLESSSGRADNGESEWMVFKDAKSAERYAVEYVKDMLEDDASMFDQKWLKPHVYVSPTDIRIISQEDADSYVDDIKYESEERLLDEAGVLQAWQGLEDKKDALNDKMMEEMDPKKQGMLQKQIDKLEQAQSKLVDKADDKLRAELAKRTADALKKDPLGWAEELGFEFDKNRPPWLQIDTRKAAAAAVKTDGVAHFLDHYDGEEVELDSGAVAFGTN